jgi:hypothetical protein
MLAPTNRANTTAAISSVQILRRKGKENNLTLREAVIAQRHPERSSRSVIRNGHRAASSGTVIAQRHPERSSRSVIRKAVIELVRHRLKIVITTCCVILRRR